jgi:hypothetical protein
MFMSAQQNTGQNYYIKVTEKPFEKLAKLKCLGTMMISHNCIHEEIKSRLNSGNACYYAVRNLFSSHLLPENVKVYNDKVACFLYECETWSLTLRSTCIESL